MKACVITEPFKYEIREVPIPEPGDDEVQIKMMAAGVCGSDMHIFKGENPLSKFPLIPGHENAGLITKVGKNCQHLKEGDHVVVDLVVRCGKCYQCTHGRGNVCENVKVRGSSTDGGWREYFTVPEYAAYKIDPKIPWRDAALVEPLAIGEHSTTRARVVPDDIVFVLGTGTIGTIIAQACKIKGAKTVICCDINDSSLERSKIFGADYTINSKTEDVIKRVQEITDGHGCTVAFDSACFPGSLSFLLQKGLVCNAGRITPLGFCTEPEGLCQNDINARELDIIGTRMSLNQFEPTAQKMADGKYHMDGLATTFVPFDKIEDVFENIVHPDPAVKKTVIVFEGA